MTGSGNRDGWERGSEDHCTVSCATPNHHDHNLTSQDICRGDWMDKVKRGQKVEIFVYDAWRIGRVDTMNYAIRGKLDFGNTKEFMMKILDSDLNISPEWRDRVREIS